MKEYKIPKSHNFQVWDGIGKCYRQPSSTIRRRTVGRTLPVSRTAASTSARRQRASAPTPWAAISCTAVERQRTWTVPSVTVSARESGPTLRRWVCRAPVSAQRVRKQKKNRSHSGNQARRQRFAPFFPKISNRKVQFSSLKNCKEI